MLPIKLKVNELTRAEREGRTHRGKVVAAEASAESGEEAGKEEGSEEDEATDEDGKVAAAALARLQQISCFKGDDLDDTSESKAPQNGIYCNIYKVGMHRD